MVISFIHTIATGYVFKSMISPPNPVSQRLWIIQFSLTRCHYRDQVTGVLFLRFTDLDIYVENLTLADCAL